MFERFTERARLALAEAKSVALAQHSASIRRHHLLIALIDAAHEGSGSVAAVLDDAGVDPGEFRGALIDSLRASETPLEEAPQSVPFSASSKKTLELSLREALSLGHNYIGREHLLLGVLRDADGPLADVVNQAGLSHVRAREIIHAHSPASRVAAARRRGGPRAFRLGRRTTEGLQDVLRQTFERAGSSKRDATTGDLLVALLQTPGTHFHSLLEGVALPNVDVVQSGAQGLIDANTPDGAEELISVEESGAVTIHDPRIAAELKKLFGDGKVTREQLDEILRRLRG